MRGKLSRFLQVQEIFRTKVRRSFKINHVDRGSQAMVQLREIIATGIRSEGGYVGSHFGSARRLAVLTT